MHWVGIMKSKFLFIKSEKKVAALFLTLLHYCFSTMLDQELILFLLLKTWNLYPVYLQYVQVKECIKEKQLAVDNLHRIYKMPGVNPEREWQK